MLDGSRRSWNGGRFPETCPVLLPIALEQLRLAGSNALALAGMTRPGLQAPPGVVLTARAYREFVVRSGLREKISLELSRKRFEDIRWEVIWDAALRIRTPLPRGLSTPGKCASSPVNPALYSLCAGGLFPCVPS